jgi:hypothetical protein
MIKLEVTPTTNSNVNYVGSAKSMASTVRFGDQVANPGTIPLENADGIFQSMMSSAKSVGDSYRAIGSGLSEIGQVLSTHAQLADENAGNEIVNKLKIKRAEINTTNQQRIGKDLSLQDLPKENDRMFNEEASNLIENTAFAYPVNREKTWQLTNLHAATQLEQEITAAAAFERKRSAQNVSDELTTDLSLAESSVGEWVRVSNANMIKSQTDKRILGIVGQEAYMHSFEQGRQKAGRQLLTNHIKSDPYKADEVFKSGGYDPILSVLPESERGVFEQDIKSRILELENKSYTDRNRVSTEELERLSVLRQQGQSFTESEILANDKLDNGNRATVLGWKIADDEKIAQENKKFVEINKVRDQFNGRGVGLSNEQMEDDAPIRYASSIKMVNDDPTKLPLLYESLKADYGRVPDSMIRFGDNPPKEGQDQAWAAARRIVVSQDNKLADKMDSGLTAVADIMATEKKTYGEAQQLYRERTEQFKNEKTYGYKTEDLVKDSPLREPEKALGKSFDVDAKNVPSGALTEFRYKAGLIRKQNPSLDDETVVQRALADMTYATTTIGSPRVMSSAPERVYKGRDFESFKKDVDDFVERREVDDFILEPTSTVINGYTTYMMIDAKTQQLVMDETGKTARLFHPMQWENSIGYEPRSEYLPTPSNQVMKGADEAQTKVPALAKHPGLLKAIVGVESSNGKNLLNPESGAFGPYQFVKSTAARFDLKKGDPIEKHHAAAAAYWDDLLNRYDGNVDKALREYSGFYAMAKPAGTVIGKSSKGTEMKSIGPQRAEEQYRDYLKKMYKYGYDITELGYKV